jgi:4-hydroxybenzoate polyprenyltransferase
MEDFAITAVRRLPFPRFLSCIRYRDTIVLQGAPILGAVFAMGGVTSDKIAALIVFAIASLLLTAHIFALNDWAGAGSDLSDPNKAPGVCLSRGVSRRQLLFLAVVLLLSSLLLLCFLGARPFTLSLLIAGLSFLYSGPALPAKGVPLLSSLTHLVGGELHFLLGYSVFAPLDASGACIAFFFALSFTAGHLTQEARDHDGDTRNGIKTNAVVFGRSQAFFRGPAALHGGLRVSVRACHRRVRPASLELGGRCVATPHVLVAEDNRRRPELPKCQLVAGALPDSVRGHRIFDGRRANARAALEGRSSLP